MVLAPLLAAPAVMLAATAAERRYGATVAGLVGAAPVALAVVILSVGDGAVAASAAAHVVAQVAFAVAFALVVVRHGGTVGALAGAAYAAVSALVEFVPAAVALAAALPALLIAPRVLPEHPSEAGAAPTPDAVAPVLVAPPHGGAARARAGGYLTAVAAFASRAPRSAACRSSGASCRGTASGPAAWARARTRRLYSRSRARSPR